jgi:hypothetical protein
MPEPDVEAGDLVSCDWDRDGTFRVAKVLVTESAGVHVRVYAERFAQRPATLPAQLGLGSIDDDSFGVGHLALTWAEFARWKPVPLAHESVSEAELDGYVMWREAADAGEAELWGREPWWRRLGARLGRSD